MRRATLIALSLVIVAALLALFYSRRGGGERYNLLLITLDTTRADRLACYGYRDATTPALDALADSGVKFTRAYCNVPLTLPSHATILTGLYPPEHGIRSNGEKSLAEKVTTLAEVFASHGYRTAAFVAAFVLDAKFGLDRGFTTYDDYEMPVTDDLYDEGMMYRYRQGDRVADSALSWLRKHSRRPFFCWVHFFDPHRPYYPHPIFDGRYRNSPYDSEIAFMDAQVGRLMEYLRLSNLIDRTIVIALGDHGEGLGQHGEEEHGLLLYNSTMHVPLIISLPGTFPRGAEVPEPISTVDLFPTVLELFGWKFQGHVSGQSFATAIGGGRIPARPIYGETEFPLTEYGWSPLQSMTTSNWKFIKAPREELYNLTDDPGELKNLAIKRAGEAGQLKSELALIEKEMVKQEASEVKLDERSREVLASLGYLGGGGIARKVAGTLRDPKDAIELRTTFVQAGADISRNMIPEGEAALQKLIKKSPETYAFRAKLAKMYYDRGMWEKAVKEFKEIAAMSPDKYGSHYNLGKALIKAGRYDQAIQELRQAIKIDPKETGGLNNLGIALFRSGRYPEAMDAFRASISLNTKQVDPHNNLGNAMLALGQGDSAMVEFRRAIEVDPDFFEGHYNLGLVLLEQGRQREAAREFRQALRLRPGFTPAHDKLNLALSKSADLR